MTITTSIPHCNNCNIQLFTGGQFILNKQTDKWELFCDNCIFQIHSGKDTV